MMLLVLITVGLFAVKVDGLPSLCELGTCGNPATQTSHLEDFCKDFTITNNKRCCVNSTESQATDTDLLGVDLTNCKLQQVTKVFENFTSLVLIDLQDNPDLASVTADDFYELTKLDFLYLSTDKKKAEQCPGGSLAWNHTEATDPASLACIGQLDTCHNVENNETCPTPESYCRTAGPGIVDCLCSPGYHGYKCLRQGTFPLIPFVGGICGGTAVLAAVLWATQRRNVKKQA